MESQPPKRLNLIDAIVLVVATAAGLALGRSSIPPPDIYVPSLQEAVKTCSVAVALTWSLAILGLYLTRYRTSWRELASQPGFSAMVAVILERIFETISWAIMGSTGGLHDLWVASGLLKSMGAWINQMKLMTLESVDMGASSAVVITVWLVTAMAGCWRGQKTWIDRAGRALGVFWILFATVYLLSLWAFPPPSPAARDMP